MGWFEALVLGIVQGLTEFLPISSSAHVSIVGRFFGSDPGAFFTAVTQLGTELAVVVYMRRDIATLASAWWRSLSSREARKDPNARVAWLVLLGSLPIIVLGLIFEDLITTSLRSLWVTCAALAGFAIVLAVADRRARNTRTVQELTWKHALTLGGWQALALIPGVSRSGGTVTGGLFLGYTREAAVRFSFLLALPAVFGSGFYGLYKSLTEESATIGTLGPTLLATVVSFVVGYATIRWLLRYIASHTFTIFVWYRLALAAVLAALLATGVIAA